MALHVPVKLAFAVRRDVKGCFRFIKILNISLTPSSPTDISPAITGAKPKLYDHITAPVMAIIRLLRVALTQ